MATENPNTTATTAVVAPPPGGRRGRGGTAPLLTNLSAISDNRVRTEAQTASHCPGAAFFAPHYVLAVCRKVRGFEAETGQKPAKAVENLRLEGARALMEDTNHTIGVVAQQTGFGDRNRMRRAFLRAPTANRRR